MERAVKVSGIVALIFVILFNSIASNIVHKKFEYKYSFKPPYLAQRDGSVPFWEYGGNAIASSENVRLAPSLKSQKGAIWSKNQVPFQFWEVDIAFRISGRGRIGADGMAFWYVQQKGDYDGPVFGSSEKWNGLAIFFDSFDNDNKHNNPHIYAVLNDGNVVFDHANDGTNQQLAGCMRDFRNKPFPTRARIDYYNNVLTVLVHNGMTNNEADYEMCFRVENVHLPKNGYFGLSAATGGLADDHDVIHFLTSSYGAPGATTPGQTMSEDQQKLQQEYMDYQKKLEEQKEQYRKENPDIKREPEDWFESDDERELRQIYQSLLQIHESSKELNRKVDEVIGKQERTMSLISHQASGGAVGANVPPPAQGQPAYSDTIRRHEVDALFNSQNKIDTVVSEIRNFILEVKQRVDTVINNQARAPTAQVQSVGYDTQSLVSEMRDGLNHVKVNMAQMVNQMSAKDGCPNVSCVSVTGVLLIVLVQLVIILGYNIYRDSKDSQSKKFY
ncbi:protein ERGIC-53 isoform X2 [Anthonomus grandis grandis]|uniref:protein ERGIC-53 isoform X2 n=1 Tax=Anthonomus grandis grandis TaxID=2921223 RepID=UPI00216555CE|nr:protein ERGIC-53 isoform X2 [Anthonomus grandis grandis]